MNQTARIIQEARAKSGLSQWAVAKALGLKSPQFVSNLERSISLCPPETAKHLHSLLGIPKSKFVWAYRKDLESAIKHHVNKYAAKIGK